jgi:hypothetical protein
VLAFLLWVPLLMAAVITVIMVRLARHFAEVSGG